MLFICCCWINKNWPLGCFFLAVLIYKKKYNQNDLSLPYPDACPYSQARIRNLKAVEYLYRYSSETLELMRQVTILFNFPVTVWRLLVPVSSANWTLACHCSIKQPNCLLCGVCLITQLMRPLLFFVLFKDLKSQQNSIAPCEEPWLLAVKS